MKTLIIILMLAVGSQVFAQSQQHDGVSEEQMQQLNDRPSFWQRLFRVIEVGWETDDL